jgi:hypothetical protein
VWRTVFISYAHAREDDAVAYRLANLIEAAGRRVWIDRLRLTQQGGGGLNQEIADAIGASCVVLLVQSGYSLASAYVQAENIHALTLGVPVLRIELERSSLPPTLMPLASAPFVPLHSTPRADWDRLTIEAMSELGIRLTLPARVDPLLKPTARVIRPAYSLLREAPEARRRAILERLLEARVLSPSNGYNSLSIAFLRLALGDFIGAAADAEQAVRALPQEGEAYYARALIAASAQPLRTMFDNKVQLALQDLARARRLSEPGAHVDVLTAIILSGHYLQIGKQPPAQPHQLMAMARGADKVLIPDELWRILDLLRVEDDHLRADIVRMTRPK